ncbi:hypothetical protein BJ138DRAFT_579965 [Hygrophoropsis aurantiaca]|uniref:Uncharacterized protein n=1 Tax=Hygrophoropsis aurantiaca TaxID=72124 RepID=A0ACB8A0Y0_9AGAM|nr:hypothetical protein BJ138DRAFT_579965 [Hygrophoropsis aurantiaca]
MGSVDMQTVKAITTYSVAISSTLFRLSYRWYTTRFWWEDTWAALALLWSLLCLICTAIQVPILDMGPEPLIDKVSVWIISICLTCVIWSVRLSIAFSFIRIAKPAPELRRFAHGVALAFALMWIGLVGQKIYVCSHLACQMGSDVAISQLVTDSVSDSILVALPFALLRGVRISRNARILILCAFSASILITAVTIAFSALLFVPSLGMTALIVAHVQAALSLLICNLLVIVTFAYRMRHKNDDNGDLDHSYAISDDTGMVQFTTVVLSQQMTESCGYASGVHSSYVGGASGGADEAQVYHE